MVLKLFVIQHLNLIKTLNHKISYNKNKPIQLFQSNSMEDIEKNLWEVVLEIITMLEQQ